MISESHSGSSWSSKSRGEEVVPLMAGPAEKNSKIKEIMENIVNVLKEKIDWLVTTYKEDPKKIIIGAILIISGVLLLNLLLNLSLLLIKRVRNKKIEKNGVLLEILPKKTSKASQTELLLKGIHSTLLNTKTRALLHGHPYLSYEIVAENGKIKFYMWVPKDYKKFLMERFYSTYPECAIRVCDDHFSDRYWTTVGDYVNYVITALKKRKFRSKSTKKKPLKVIFKKVKNIFSRIKVFMKLIKDFKSLRSRIKSVNYIKLLKKLNPFRAVIKIIGFIYRLNKLVGRVLIRMYISGKKFISGLPIRRKMRSTEVELVFHHVFSLNKNIDSEDLLNSIIPCMRDMEYHEKTVLQVICKPLNSSWQMEGREILDQYEIQGKRPRRNSKRSRSIFSKLRKELDEQIEREKAALGIKTQKVSKRKTRSDRKEINVATDKIQESGFETSIRVACIGKHRKGNTSRMKSLSGTFNELDKENRFVRRRIYAKKWYYNRMRKRRIYLNDRRNILVPSELSQFFLRIPGENLIRNYQEIESLTIKEFAPPMNVETVKLLIGMNTYRGVDTYIGMKIKDLVRHMIVQGTTGSGKSEWVKTILKDIMDAGYGFALLEPHGPLAQEVMEIVPEHRRKDVIVFDIFGDYPTPFNFCKIHPRKGIRREQIVEKTTKEIIEVFKVLFSDAWSTKNAYFLENAIKTVIELKDGNIVDIRKLFYDKDFREYAIKNISDPQLKHFWRSAFKTDRNGKLASQSTIDSVDYKLGAFLNSKAMLRLVGQDDCIDFKEIMDNNKILIFKFNKEYMSEDQLRFIGGIAIKLMVVQAYQRDKSKWNNPFVIVPDEAQNYLDASIKTGFFELRKYGVPFIILHQVLEQLDKVKGLKEAIYGNAGTKLTFTTGELDAPFFEKLYGPQVDQDDLTNLPSRYGYCKMLVDGKISDTFNIYSLDRPEVSKEEGKKSIKEIEAYNREGKKHYKEIDKMLRERIYKDEGHEKDDFYEECAAAEEERPQQISPEEPEYPQDVNITDKGELDQVDIDNPFIFDFEYEEDPQNYDGYEVEDPDQVFEDWDNTEELTHMSSTDDNQDDKSIDDQEDDREEDQEDLWAKYKSKK